MDSGDVYPIRFCDRCRALSSSKKYLEGKKCPVHCIEWTVHKSDCATCKNYPLKPIVGRKRKRAKLMGVENA